MNSFLDGRSAVSAATTSVVSAPTPTSGFLPVLGVAHPKPSAPETLQPFATHRHGEAKVEAVEVDGVIQKIIVICGCGDRIEVHCGY